MITALKISVVNTLFHPYQIGGAEKSVQEILDFLGRECDVTLMTLKDKNDHNIDSFEILGPLRIYRYQFRFRYWPFPKRKRSLISRSLWHSLDLMNVGLFIRILIRLKKDAPDVLMTHNLTGFSFSPWLAARVLRVPVLHVLHDYNLLCPNTTMRKNGSNCSSICFPCKPRLMSTKLFSNISALVGVSEFIVNRHRKYLKFPGRTIFRVAHGCPNFTPLPRNQVSYDYGFLGGLNEVKGIDVYLEAARQLPEKLFAVAGKPSSEFAKKIEGLGNIKFLGWTNPAQFYASVGVLVVPSVWNDPAPRVVLEAHHAGLGLVISDLPTLVEIAQYNKANFVTFAPGSPESLVEVLRNLEFPIELNATVETPVSQGEQIKKILDEMNL